MPNTPASFGYKAQTSDGAPLSGTLEAATAEEARQRLAGLGVRVVEIEPAAAPPRGKALRGEDFLAFNQQLAQLTAAGLPLEGSLRLIAQDMGRGRLAQSVRELAAELERGKPLAEAFEAQRGRFPPLYGRIMEAGVRTGRLPGMLLSLGRHLELLQRLRYTLWQAIAYPLILLVMMLLVLLFISLVVLPQFAALFVEFEVTLPVLTRAVLTVPYWLPPILLVLLALAIAAPLLGRTATALARRRPALDRAVLAVPLIGPVLRHGMLARWCDALRLGVEAGLDLPAALELASDASGSAAARRDAQRLTAALAAGRPLADAEPCAVLPPTVLASIDLAAQRHDLGAMLAHLADLYHQKTEMRVMALQVFLTPALLLFLAVGVGIIVLALVLPIVRLISSLV